MPLLACPVVLSRAYLSMTANLSLPMFNPNTGRLGTLLEALHPAGQASRLPDSSPGRRDACPTPLPMSLDEARRRGWAVEIARIEVDAAGKLVVIPQKRFSREGVESEV